MGITMLRRVPGTKEGHYSVVFMLEDRAIKVFKRMQGQDRHVRNVFQSEVAAYNIARNTGDLKGFVAHFIGPMPSILIYDMHGNDISSQFVPDCVYEMRRVEGLFRKIGTLDRRQYEELLARFARAGIRHIRDSSVVTDGVGTVSAIIDFALDDYSLEHPAQIG